MKNYAILIFAVFALAACNNTGTSSTDSTTTKMETAAPADMAKVETLEFSVKGMTCEGCENTVMKSVKKLDGIAEVVASHEKETAVVKFDTSLVSTADIEKAITDVGYKVEGFSKKE